MRAEYIKGKCGGILPVRERWMLEVFIPSGSIAALVGVTIWITQQAVVVIQNEGDGSKVNVYFLYGYAAGNMLIDIVSTRMFYSRRHDVFTNIEFQTIEVDHAALLSSSDEETAISSSSAAATAATTAAAAAAAAATAATTTAAAAAAGGHHLSLPSNSSAARNDSESKDSSPVDPSVGGLNVNMISAFTHVGSDTLRTLSVFGAAMFVSIFGFSSSLCDAWAAVAVSSTIVVFVCPLSLEIYRKAKYLLANGAALETVVLEGSETQTPMQPEQMA
jgi:Co/Zn/Cd efflux system component